MDKKYHDFSVNGILVEISENEHRNKISNTYKTLINGNEKKVENSDEGQRDKKDEQE